MSWGHLDVWGELASHKISRLGIKISLSIAIYVCLSGQWLGGLLHLSFLSYFFKLVCYAHVFPCTLFFCNINVQ